MKTKLIIKSVAFLMLALFSFNCKKNDTKPATKIPATGTGYVTVGAVTYTGDCILASNGVVQIINYSPTTFELTVQNMPQQSSGTVTFTINPGTPIIEFNTNAPQVYGSGGLNVGQITKTGARSFQFSCTLYLIDNNGVPSPTPNYFTGAGSY